MSGLLPDNKIDMARWQQLDIFAQLGNVGSEVGRAFKWQLKENLPLAESAFWRGLELLDATIADVKNLKRGRELRRARELFCCVYYKTDEYTEAPASLEAYFTQFALQARRGV